MYATTLTPRISETDAVGHINNTTIPIWLEAGRHRIFALFNPDHKFHDWKMIIVKSTVEYKEQIFFGLDVEIYCWIKRIGNTSLELYEEIWQAGKKCVISSAVYVNFNKEYQRSEPIPFSARTELEQHLYESM